MNETSLAIRTLLEQKLQQLLPNENIEAHHIDQILAYLALLQQWNKVYNLTAIDDLSEMIYKHVLDSLSILPYIGETTCLDVGSGAGLPGVLLAIFRPQTRFALLDTNGKKTRFLTMVKLSLKLDNMMVVQARVENYQATELFAQVTSRAFSDLTSFTQQTKHLLRSDGQWLAMKGQYPTEELTQLSEEVAINEVIGLSIPNEPLWQRHLVIIKKQEKIS